MDFITMIKSGAMSVNGHVIQPPTPSHTTTNGHAVDGVGALPATADHVVMEKKKIKKAKYEPENDNLQEIVKNIIEEKPRYKTVLKEFRRVAEIFQAEKDEEDMRF